MSQLFGCYSPMIVWEFYDSYALFTYLVTLAESRIVDQPQLTHTLVRGVRVDISEKAVR